ncbi:MAG: glycosyltransferase family 39 protein [Candidatus Hydrogenedentes bacterium]|nr:glycosyltransferase family 39 protein [Candidatus Hydrogenedentota bacterium]
MATRSATSGGLERRRRMAVAAALGSILVLGFLLRCTKLNVGFWVDEIYTAQGASLDFSDCLMHRLYPLCYVLAHFMLRLGDSESLLRLPSLVAGVAGIAALYGLAKEAHSRAAGLVAAFLLALSAYHVHYSQDARFYAFAALAGIWIVHALFRAITRGRRADWASYIGACLFALSVQLTMAPFIVAAAAGAALWGLATRAPDTGKRRLRAVGLLVLCTALGSLGVVTLSVVRSDSPLHFVAGAGLDDHWADAGADAKTPLLDRHRRDPGLTGGRAHRLTPMEYGAYLSEYFRFQFAPLGWAALALAVLGLGVLWRRSSAWGAILLAALALFPVPFFLVDVRHVFVSRYFIPVLPIGLLLVAAGVAVCIEYAGRRSRTLHGLAAAAILALLAGDQAIGLARQYQRPLEEDWRAMAGCMAETLAPRDVILVGDDAPLAHPCLAFYLPRMRVDAATLNTVRYVAVSDAAGVRAALLRHPCATLWLVTGEAASPDTLEQTAGAVFERSGTFGAYALWCLGKPTVNLFPFPGFESADALPALPPGVELAGGDEARSGEHSLRIAAIGPEGAGPSRESGVRTPDSWVARFELLPDRVRLRNPGFEIWEQDAAPGWRAIPDGAGTATPSESAYSGRYAARLNGEGGRGGLVQIIDGCLLPGRRISVRCMGKAAAPDAMGLAFRFDEGADTRRIEARHPGGGEWCALAVEAEVPAYAVPGSVAIELWRQGDSEGGVSADAVSVEILSDEAFIDPTRNYVLSMDVKWEGVQRKRAPVYTSTKMMPERGSDVGQPGPVGRVVLSGEYLDGYPFEYVLYWISGTCDWHRIAVLVESESIPPGARNLALSVGVFGTTDTAWLEENGPDGPAYTRTVSVYEGEGRIWVDNVQFEPGNRPTPLAWGIREPHDERAAAVDWGAGEE